MSWSIPVPEMPAWLKKYVTEPATPPRPLTVEEILKLSPLPPPPPIPILISCVPAPREVHGFFYSAREFNEFTSPEYTIIGPPSHTLIRFDWQREEKVLKRRFADRYLICPPHPERVTRTPGFLRDTRLLVGYLGEPSMRLRLADAQDAALTVYNAVVASLSTDAYLAAWTDGDDNAPIDDDHAPIDAAGWTNVISGTTTWNNGVTGGGWGSAAPLGGWGTGSWGGGWGHGTSVI
ncbi:hypothetical protein C8R45DRAFT_1096414 [Mycena sanguinolenta]|nr:hypothetical protein C8R45DRAFT_1096414 [Mycena sanguinolenta]